MIDQYFNLIKRHVFPTMVTDSFCCQNEECFSPKFAGWEMYRDDGGIEKEDLDLQLDINVNKNSIVWS